AGLVNLKELLEELVGPVGEEGETPEEEFEAIDQDTFQVDGGMSIDEANEELGLSIPKGDYDTVAGFTLGMLGHIPEEGEHFHYDTLRFEILEMKNLKIEQIKITRHLFENPQDGIESIESSTSKYDRSENENGTSGSSKKTD
ncbi:MAG: hypothetical protein O2854_07725, partial [Chloroflexi bacterium]|nr:hypothetical protein [Chloroflexota bacterium]